MQSLPAVFSPSSSQILLVTAMYSVRGTLRGTYRKLGALLQKRLLSIAEGLAGQVDDPFLSDVVSGTGVFLYS